mmetsp:Transcript_7004/g.13933  ORF Transcript_7004/g.13933 Transcript_7004/m.13933 type:complete len:317 (-) Transcript_7004:613-1563(-)
MTGLKTRRDSIPEETTIPASLSSSSFFTSTGSFALQMSRADTKSRMAWSCAEEGSSLAFFSGANGARRRSSLKGSLTACKTYSPCPSSMYGNSAYSFGGSFCLFTHRTIATCCCSCIPIARAASISTEGSGSLPSATTTSAFDIIRCCFTACRGAKARSCMILSACTFMFFWSVSDTGTLSLPYLCALIRFSEGISMSLSSCSTYCLFVLMPPVSSRSPVARRLFLSDGKGASFVAGYDHTFNLTCGVTSKIPRNVVVGFTLLVAIAPCSSSPPATAINSEDSTDLASMRRTFSPSGMSSESSGVKFIPCIVRLMS